MPFIQTDEIINLIEEGKVEECYASQNIHPGMNNKLAPIVAHGFAFNQGSMKVLLTLKEKGFSSIPVIFHKESREEQAVDTEIEHSIRIQQKIQSSIKSSFETIKNDTLDSKSEFNQKVGQVLSQLLDDIIADFLKNPNLELCFRNFGTVEGLEAHLSRVTYLTGFLFMKSVKYLKEKEKLLRNYSPREKKVKLKRLLMGTMLHDLGKLEIEPELLNREHRLTEEDFSEIKTKMLEKEVNTRYMDIVRKISDANRITRKQKNFIDKQLYNPEKPDDVILTEDQYNRLTLERPGNLLPEEVEEVKSHTVKGWAMMSRWEIPVARTIAILHHKNFNGTGYPAEFLDGRPTPTDKNIHVFARMVNITNIYDSLVSERPYRHSYHPAMALAMMIKFAQGRIFDPDLFSIFLNCVPPFQVGDQIILSNKFKGIVWKQNKNAPFHPKVIMVFDPNGNKIPLEEIHKYKLDLCEKKNAGVFITEHKGMDVSGLTKNGNKGFLSCFTDAPGTDIPQEETV